MFSLLTHAALLQKDILEIQLLSLTCTISLFPGSGNWGWLKIRSLLSLDVTSKCKQTRNSLLCCYRLSRKGWLC